MSLFPVFSPSYDFSGKSLQESYWQGNLGNVVPRLSGLEAWEDFILFFKKILIKIFEILFVPILCVRMYVHVPWSCSAQRGLKRVLDLLGLELCVLVGCLVDVGIKLQSSGLSTVL